MSEPLKGEAMSLRPAAAFVTAMLVFLPLRLAALDLKLENVRTTASQFDFTKIAESSDDPVAAGGDAFTASTPSYILWMNPDGVREVPQFDYFRYDIYARPKT